MKLCPHCATDLETEENRRRDAGSLVRIITCNECLTASMWIHGRLANWHCPEDEFDTHVERPIIA